MKMNKKIMAMFLVAGLSTAFVGCASESTQTPETNVEQQTPEVTLTAQEIYVKAVEGVQLPNLMETDETMFADVYSMDATLLEDYVVMMPMMSGTITEIAVFKVADPANIELVVQAANSRLEALKNGGAFYPSHVEIVEKGQVVQQGNYVLFVADENVETIVANFNALFN